MTERADRAEPSRSDHTKPYRSPLDDDALGAAFADGEFPVAVYGLGKMGLPLAAVYASVCGTVIGTDVDPTVVDRVADGDCPVENEPGLDDLVAGLVATNALDVTAEPKRAADRAAIHVVVVPTLVEDGEPDLSALEAACVDIGSGLAPDDMVIVESTVPPGTCRDVVEPLLAEASGVSTDQFGVAFCPERTASGRALRDIRGAYPKVVGGTDAESGRVATAVYEHINDEGVLPVADATTAEAVKVFEGVYRDVNIALANELATFTDDLGIDVREAIATANTQPYCNIHDPGPGVGGHCIPYYPYFLFANRERDAPVTETARGVNDWMPQFTVDRLFEMLRDQGVSPSDATVLVLGVTYRPGVKETRASPALRIADILSETGAVPLGVDPMIDDWDDLPLERVALDGLDDVSVDGVLLVTPHEAFDGIDWNDFDAPLAVLDGRDSLNPDAVTGSNRQLYTLGRGFKTDVEMD